MELAIVGDEDESMVIAVRRPVIAKSPGLSAG